MTFLTVFTPGHVMYIWPWPHLFPGAPLRGGADLKSLSSIAVKYPGSEGQV